jgi:hypothetical protein
MFILISALKTTPENAIPLLRKDTQEELIALIESESRVDTATGKAEWVPTSQLAMFLHPQEIQAVGGFPIQEIQASTSEEWVALASAVAEAEWAQFTAIPTELDRYVSQEESGIDFKAISKMAVSVDPTSPVTPIYYTCDYDHGTFAVADPQPKIVDGINQDSTEIAFKQYFVKHPDGSFSAANPNPATEMDVAVAPSWVKEGRTLSDTREPGEDSAAVQADDEIFGRLDD